MSGQLSIPIKLADDYTSKCCSYLVQLLDSSVKIEEFSEKRCCLFPHISVNGKTAASGLPNVMTWLQQHHSSEYQCSKENNADERKKLFDQMCCFPSKAIHQKLLSSMKRLEEWRKGWESNCDRDKAPRSERMVFASRFSGKDNSEDGETSSSAEVSAMEQLKVAVCRQRLFDRLLKNTGTITGREDIPFLIQYKFNHCDLRVKDIEMPTHVTIIDVGCLFFILPWFNRHCRAAMDGDNDGDTGCIMEICRAIPHVVAYVLRTCRLLTRLHVELGVDTVLDELIRASSFWMDNVDESSLEVSFSVVNITYKMKNKVKFAAVSSNLTCKIGKENIKEQNSSERSCISAHNSHMIRNNDGGEQEAVSDDLEHDRSMARLLKALDWRPLQEMPVALGFCLPITLPVLVPVLAPVLALKTDVEPTLTRLELESVKSESVVRINSDSCSYCSGNNELDCYPGISAGSSRAAELEHFWELAGLPRGREVRKKQQILSLVSIVLPLLPVGGCLAEFCCGGGYVGLLTAFLRRDVTVLLVDRNSVSLSYASIRVHTLGLSNVSTRECDLLQLEQYLQECGHCSRDSVVSAAVNISSSKFAWLHNLDIGVALHACGRATDVVQHVCMQVRASFVLAPCCYGFIQHWRAIRSNAYGAGVCSLCDECRECKYVCGSYPKSAMYKDAGWRLAWFESVCARADRTFNSHDARSDVFDEGARIAMRVIDTDRLLCARERGYVVAATTMWPLNASCKNHILVGKQLQ